jgi:hypothetical protein
MNKIQFIVMALILSSCSTYSGKFICPDSLGANCVMMSRVDQMIDSGEINEIYSQGKKCKNGSCKTKLTTPEMSLGTVHEIKIEKDDQPDTWQDGNNIYIK